MVTSRLWCTKPKEARIDSQLGQEHFWVGFRVEEKGLGSCNRFEEINKYLLTAYFEVIQGHFF